jgi:hypothetical protein
MTKLKLWNKGDNIILRGIYESRPVYAQSMRVVKDVPNETALLLLPGAECMATGGYIHHGHNGKWNRWAETISNRTPQGFDTLDLDLDIVVEASHRWKWKDETEYQNGIPVQEGYCPNGFGVLNALKKNC